jgi:hypothetical protein
MCDLHGLFAASKSLRHTDLRTTSEFYVDSRARLTPNFSVALSGNVVGLPKPSEHQSSAPAPESAVG